MLKWVLLAAIYFPSSVSITTHEFATRNACVAAENAIIEDLKDSHDVGYTLRCIPDGFSEDYAKSHDFSNVEN